METAKRITNRQHQLLEALGLGCSNEQTAVKLGISPHTVKVHLWRLYQQLGVKSRTQALAWYAQQRQAEVVAINNEMFAIVQRLARLRVALENGNSAAEQAACMLAEQAEKLMKEMP